MKRALTNHGLEALLDTFKEQNSGEEKFSIKISEISALNADRAKLMAVDGLGDRKRKKTEDERSAQKIRIIEEQADNLSRLTLGDKVSNNSISNLRSHPTGGSWIQNQMGEERYRLMLIDELSGGPMPEREALGHGLTRLVAKPSGQKIENGQYEKDENPYLKISASSDAMQKLAMKTDNLSLEGLVPAAAFYDGAYGKVDLEKIDKGPPTDFSDLKINTDPNEESKWVALKMQKHFATFMGTTPQEVQNCCVYCYHLFYDGKPDDNIFGHNLIDENYEVTCPVMSKYKCQLCQATGPKAHTLTFCPKALHQ